MTTTLTNKTTATPNQTDTTSAQAATPTLAVDEFILHTSKRHPAVWVALSVAVLVSLLVSTWLLLPLLLLAVQPLGYSFSVTSRQIIEHKGVFWHKARCIPLNELVSIDLVNRDFGLFFQVGKLTVTTRSGKSESFSWVAQPERLDRLLDHQHGGCDLDTTSEPVRQVRRLRNSLSHLV